MRTRRRSGWASALIAIAACGRIGFDARGDASATGDAGVHVTLRLDRVDPGETLVDFPLLVVLDDTRANRARIAPDASDVQFFDASGNQLDREIEQVGAMGGAPLIAWVRVPTIVGLTTTIDLVYGAPVAASPGSPWNNSYISVWHLSDSGTAVDSTHQHDAVASGTTLAAGQIGGGRRLVSGDYLAVQDTSLITPTAFTAQAWMKATALSTSYQAALAREVGETSDDDIYLALNASQAIVTCETANVEKDAVGGTATAGFFYHLVGTADGVTELLYLDGNQVASIPVGGPLQSDLRPLFLGADRNGPPTPLGSPGNDFFDGVLDEVRLEGVARDAAWISYEDKAMRDGVITY